uniref:Uncharacterized protein n=1 Tax=Lactuca sativa TaxID=4236 RepID=A0A9R1W8Q3_LACSA|nr:hypothetical protein LSAT_V11C300136660 [Lactuca sativa]
MDVFPDAYHGYSSKSVLIYCRLRIGHSKNLDYLCLPCMQSIYYARLLSTAFTPYAEMVLHKRMQKSLGWKAPNIPLEIPSLLPSDIFRRNCTS